MVRCFARSCSFGVLALVALAGCSRDQLFIVQRGQPIVGGTPATDSFLPAVGALAAYGSYGYDVMVMPFCTGTLISDRLVVSAAHCVEAIGNEIPSGTPIGFFTGSNAASSSAYAKVLPFKSWQAHPNYPGGTPPGELANYFDIAVLQLEAPTSIPPMKMVRPAEVSALLRPGTDVLIVGYGMTDPNNQNSSGAKYYGSTELQQVGSSEIWIMSQGSGPQKCNGDSGGPTFADASAGGQDYRIIGVASRAGEGCVYGSVETRIDTYLSWIHSFGPIPCGSGLSDDCGAPPPPPPPPPPPAIKKKIGEACKTAGECEGNLCIVGDGGLVCSELCASSQPLCPAGYGCAPLAGRPEGACVKEDPAATNKPLGDACEDGSECESGICLDGDERVCVQGCTVEVGCDDESMQCVEDNAGQLACTPRQQVAIDGARSSGGCSVTAGPAPGPAPALLLVVAMLVVAPLVRRRRSK